MIRLTEKERTILIMEENTKVNGCMICAKGKANKYLQMVLNFKELIIKIKKVEKESFTGPMEMPTQDSFAIIKEKEKVL